MCTSTCPPGCSQSYCDFKRTAAEKYARVMGEREPLRYGADQDIGHATSGRLTADDARVIVEAIQQLPEWQFLRAIIAESGGDPKRYGAGIAGFPDSTAVPDHSRTQQHPQYQMSPAEFVAETERRQAAPQQFARRGETYKPARDVPLHRYSRSQLEAARRRAVAWADEDPSRDIEGRLRHELRGVVPAGAAEEREEREIRQKYSALEQHLARVEAGSRDRNGFTNAERELARKRAVQWAEQNSHLDPSGRYEIELQNLRRATAAA